MEVGIQVKMADSFQIPPKSWAIDSAFSGDFQGSIGFGIIGHSGLYQNNGIDFTGIDLPLGHQLLSNVTLEGCIAKDVLFVPFDDKLNSVVAQIANAIEQDYLFIFHSAVIPAKAGIYFFTPKIRSNTIKA